MESKIDEGDASLTTNLTQEPHRSPLNLMLVRTHDELQNLPNPQQVGVTVCRNCAERDKN